MTADVIEGHCQDPQGSACDEMRVNTDGGKISPTPRTTQVQGGITLHAVNCDASK